MNTATIALVIFFTGFLLRVIHHLIVYFSKASAIPVGEEQAPKKKFFSFLGILLILGALVYPFFPQLFAPFSMQLPMVLKITGILFMLFSGAIIIWIQLLFGKGYNGTPSTRTDQRILTTGPFKYVRHPMYASTIIFILGFALAMDNYLLALFGAVSYYIPVLIIAKREEQILVGNYGQEYIDYMNNTGRFLPRL